jgi:hypothetical protein
LKQLLSGLRKITNIEGLVRLKSILKGSNLYFKELNTLGWILEVYEESGNFPSIDDIKDQYDIEENFFCENFDDLLEDRIAYYRDKVVREQIMDISSKPIVSINDINEVADKLSINTKEKDIDTVKNIDGQTIYTKIKDSPIGARFFINELDEEVIGVSVGNILTIFGWVGSCKTTLALSMAYGNAFKLDYNVVFVSFEVPKNELYFNLLSRHAYELDPDKEISAKRIKKALLSEEEEDFLWNEVEPSFKSMKGNIILLDQSDVTSDSGMFSDHSFKATLDEVNERIGVDMMFFDYAQLVTSFTILGHRYYGTEAANEFITYYNSIVNYYDGRGLIGVLVSQANRDGWTKAVRRSGEYQLNALAELNRLEKASYYVVSLFYDQEMRASGEIRVQLLKHRAGDIIQTPFTVPAEPGCFFIGDTEDYNQTFTEDVLDEVMMD